MIQQSYHIYSNAFGSNAVIILWNIIMRDLFLIIIAYRAIFSVSANSHDGRCYSDPNGNQQQCSKQKTEEGIF